MLYKWRFNLLFLIANLKRFLSLPSSDFRISIQVFLKRGAWTRRPQLRGKSRIGCLERQALRLGPRRALVFINHSVCVKHCSKALCGLHTECGLERLPPLQVLPPLSSNTLCYVLCTRFPLSHYPSEVRNISHYSESQAWTIRSLATELFTFAFPFHWVLSKLWLPSGLHTSPLPPALALTLLPPPSSYDETTSGSWMQVACTIGIISWCYLAAWGSHLET